MIIYPWARNANYWMDSEIRKWFLVCDNFKIPKTLMFTVESGRLHELENICKHIKKDPSIKLAIRVSPDDQVDANRKALHPFVQSKDDEWWMKFFTDEKTAGGETYNQVLRDYDVEPFFVYYDMEGYHYPEYSIEIIRSRMLAWESIICDYLFDNIPFTGQQVWYGNGWQIPSVNTFGNIVGSHAWNRVYSIDDIVNPVNMYWQLPDTLKQLKDSGEGKVTILTHWCGMLKDFTTGRDRVATKQESAHQKFWGEVFRSSGWPQIQVIYGSNRGLGKSDEIADRRYWEDLLEYFTALFGPISTNLLSSLVPTSIKSIDKMPKRTIRKTK